MTRSEETGRPQVLAQLAKDISKLIRNARSHREGEARGMSPWCRWGGEDEDLLVARALEGLAAEGVRERGSPGACAGGDATGLDTPELSEF